MAPQKGKQGTKGQKQIVEENKQTIRFYSIMAISALRAVRKARYVDDYLAILKEAKPEVSEKIVQQVLDIFESCGKGLRFTFELPESGCVQFRDLRLSVHEGQAVHFIAHVVLWRDSLTLSYTLLLLFSMLVYGGCIQTMRYMARASYSETGQLLDGGLDLNMAQAGMGEHLKDLIILTACIQTLSLASTYAWFLWLVAPAYAFYLLWVNVLGPWFFQPAPPEVDDKKQKKLERKSRRH